MSNPVNRWWAVVEDYQWTPEHATRSIVAMCDSRAEAEATALAYASRWPGEAYFVRQIQTRVSDREIAVGEATP
jgi:hypothetical protein